MPANPPLSPFLQFAQYANTLREGSDLLGRLETADALKVAERHARLLAQIEQTINGPMEAYFHDGYARLDPALDAQRKLAHIRAILEQP